MIKLTEPTLDIPAVLDRIKKVLNSGWLTAGKAVEEFEEAISAYTGVPHAVAVCNATIGIELALRAMGAGPGDEVIVPAYTHAGTVWPVYTVGATVVRADVSVRSYQIDPSDVAKLVTPHTRAVIPVSLFGYPLVPGWREFKNAYPHISLIEDGACTLGAGLPYSCWGDADYLDAVVLSFHPKKIITTGEGGMILTRSAERYDSLKHRRNFGFGGTNAKMSDISAALGLTQANNIFQRVFYRRAVAHVYTQAFRGLPIQITMSETANFQSYVMAVKERDELIAFLSPDIEAQVGCFGYTSHAGFKGAEFLDKHLLALPISSSIPFKDVTKVIERVEDFYQKGRQRWIKKL